MFDLARRPGDLAAVLNRLSDAPAEPPAAIILGASPNGLSFVRSIGRRGVPVVVMEGPGDLPGLHSRYGIGVRMPDPVERHDFWMETLLSIGRSLPVRPVLIPTGDVHVLMVSRERASLCRYFRFVLPDEEVVEKLPNKREQYGLAERNGLEAPKTFYPESEEEAIAAGDAVGFPCIVKPYYSHLWKRHKEGKLLEVADREELRRAFAEGARIGQAVMVQEKIPGGDDQLFGLLVYYDRETRPICLFTKRKLRQNPVEYGDGSFQVSVRIPELMEMGDRFCRAIGYQGLGGFEWKRDPRDGRYKLIELNPRSVSAESLTTASGMDIPWIAYRDIGELERLEPTDSFREGVYWVNLRWDFHSFQQNRRRGNLTFFGWAGSLLGKPLRHAFLDWRDPAPAWRVAWAAARNLLGRSG
ncbi:MAG: hypothetical protein JW958_11150 [Candidatus Eisenbacteria bacterium]|nr:hypothetical protein [Candidatus Eisenbacteria bacterium]